MDRERERILAAILDDRGQLDTAAAASLVAACDEDPTLRHRCHSLLLIDEALSRLSDPERQHFDRRVAQALQGCSTDRFTSRVLASNRRRQRRRRHRSMALVLAVAATACLALFLTEPAATGSDQPWTVVSGSADALIEGPTNEPSARDSDRLAAGDALLVRTGSVDVQLPGGGRLICHPGSYRRPTTEHVGVSLTMEHGRIAADLPRQLPRPLRLQTADCLVEVTGTRFELTSDASGSRVQVARGSVVVSDRRGRQEPRQLTAHQALAIPALGPAHAGTIAATVIDASRRPRQRIYHSDGSDQAQAELTYQAQIAGRQAWRLELAGPAAWWAQELRPRLDASASDGLLLDLHGSGDGATWLIEVADRGDPSHSEHFIARWIDDRPGWQQLVIPWSAFERRDWQPDPAAPDDGLDRNRLAMFGMIRTAHPTPGNLGLGRVATWTR